MKSKKIVRDHIQRALDNGMLQKDVSKGMGFTTPNNISMLMSDKTPKNLLSPNRVPQLQKVCGLSDNDVLVVTLARLEDAGENPVEMSKETLLFLFKAFFNVMNKGGSQRLGGIA